MIILFNIFKFCNHKILTMNHKNVIQIYFEIYYNEKYPYLKEAI